MQKKTFDIQNPTTVPARLHAVGNQMLQTSTIQHILLYVCPMYNLFLYQQFSKQQHLCLFSESKKASAGKFTIRLLHFTPIFHIIHWCQNYSTSAPSDMQMISFCSQWKNKVQKAFLCFSFTSSEANRTSLGRLESPFSFISGQNLYLAKFIAYILEIEPPAKRDIQILY